MWIYKVFDFHEEKKMYFDINIKISSILAQYLILKLNELHLTFNKNSIMTRIQKNYIAYLLNALKKYDKLKWHRVYNVTCCKKVSVYISNKLAYLHRKHIKVDLFLHYAY